MDKLLIIITRPDGTTEIGDLWPNAGPKTVGDSMIWVIDGTSTGLPGSNGWTRAFNTISDKPEYSNFHTIGVIYHRQNGRFNDGTNASADLVTSFPGVGNRHNAYSSGGNPEKPEYVEHREMAEAMNLNPQSADAKARFERFWLTCFGDPILEDLILLLKTHASMKADKVEISDLETLKSAVNGEATIGEEALTKVRGNLNGVNSYEALRKALVKAVVEQEGKKRG